jgi:hypothetical protein
VVLRDAPVPNFATQTACKPRYPARLVPPLTPPALSYPLLSPQTTTMLDPARAAAGGRQALRRASSSFVLNPGNEKARDLRVLVGAAARSRERGELERTRSVIRTLVASLGAHDMIEILACGSQLSQMFWMVLPCTAKGLMSQDELEVALDLIERDGVSKERIVVRISQADKDRIPPLRYMCPPNHTYR